MQEPRALTVRSGHQVERNQISGNARVQFGDQYNVTYQTQGVSSAHEQFLDSLWFDTIDERRDNIKVAAPGTLKWIYNNDPARAERFWEEPSQWDSFTEWLLNENSTYWICGKAGSGKSTLMSHLTGDERTLERLQRWSPDRKLHVLSFFFWRPGNELQKSVVGMLRSLLCQICEHEPSLIDKLVAHRNKRRLGLTVWTEKNLKELVLKALAYSSDSYCVFIDGLDEYVGPCDILLDLISNLQGFESVKCCVASRPEVDLFATLSTCKKLRLENLNRADMLAYTSRRLAPLDKAPALYDDPEWQLFHLCYELVERASGVFLWVVLAIPPILKGAHSGDNLETLMQRLKSLPSDMSRMYARMIENIDPMHQKSLALYLHAMRLQSEQATAKCLSPTFPRLTDIVAAQLLDEQCRSYATMRKLCELEIVKIVNQSAGLLEVISVSEIVRRVHSPLYLNGFWIPGTVDDYLGAEHSCVTSMSSAEPHRSNAGHDAHYRGLWIENLRTAWVHRSAHDFVFPADGSQSPLHYMLSDYATARQKLWEGALRIVTLGHVTPKNASSNLASRVHRLTTSLCVGIQADPDGAMRILESLHHLMTKLGLDETNYGLVFGRFISRTFVFEAGNMLVWEAVVEGKFWKMLESCMSHLRSEPAGNTIFIPLMNRIIGWLQESLLENDASTKDVRIVVNLVLSLLVTVHGNIKDMARLLPKAVAETDVCWFSTLGSFPQLKPSYYESSSVSGMIWSNSTVSQTLERLNLAQAAIRWNSLVRASWRESKAEGFETSPEVRQITEMLDEIMDTTDAYFELNFADDHCSAHECLSWFFGRVLLHVSHKLACALEQYGMCLPETLRTELSADLRVICFPVHVAANRESRCGQTRDFISFTPSRAASDQLLLSLQKLERVEYFRSWFTCGVRHRELMSRRQWMNVLMCDLVMNQPQLNSLQRTLALACIRTHFGDRDHTVTCARAKKDLNEPFDPTPHCIISTETELRYGPGVIK